MLGQQYDVKSSVPTLSPTASSPEIQRMELHDSNVLPQDETQVKSKLRVQGFNFFYGSVQAL